MKSKVKIMAAVAVFIMLCAKTAPSIQAASQVKMQTTIKKQFAAITEGKINKNKVKKGDTLKYNFIITNTDLEKLEYSREDVMSFSESEDIYKVVIVWQSPKKQSIVHRFTGKYNKKSKTFRISGKIKINKGMQQGKWKLEKISLYSIDDSGDRDFDSGYAYIYNIEKKSKYTLDAYSEYADLSFADFSVKGTGKKLDKEGPSVSPKSLKLSKTALKSGNKSKFSMKISDKSQIISVECNWNIYGKGRETDGDSVSYPMYYNKKKKVYECNIKMKRSDKKAKLYRIVLMDIYGNTKEYNIFNKKDKCEVNVFEQNFYDKYKNYYLKKKERNAFEKMVITRKKKYIKF